MQQINECFCDYNKNLLTTDFLFDNTIPWIFTLGNGIPGVSCDTSLNEKYVENKSLRIYNPSFTLNDITVKPLNNTDYTFVVPITGNYIFSIRTLLKTSFNNGFEINGGITFYKNGNGAPYKTFPIEIKDFSNTIYYQYNKWVTTFKNVDLIEGDVITLSIHINFGIAPSDELELYFDGFKLEYVGNRNQDVPSYYTKPQI